MASATSDARSGPAKNKGGKFPQPEIITPSQTHRQTFIILHGRGSTAKKFGPPLLETTTPSGEKLQTAFPHAKIIFPTASMNKAVIYKGSSTHQWFDHWHMHEHNKRQELMIPGLHKSCEYIHNILREEIELVGKENVVLWGLSQGCATSLISLLTWDGEPIGATIGMCGYLPFENHIKGFFDEREDGDDDPFANSDDEGDNDVFDGDGSSEKDSLSEAVSFLREEIDMGEKTGMVFREVPIFLGHGTEDDKVPIEHGRAAETCLELLGADVQMVEYTGLDHWYSAEMMGDIFDFLREKLGIVNVE